MRMIWATRGRTWGFKFLKDGGFADPLIPYETAFGSHMSEPQLWLPGKNSIALRFQDPLQRKDSAGRVISHDFVLFSPPSELMSTFEVAQQHIWKMVSQEYADMWDSGN